jgi:hypothetical protein
MKNSAENPDDFLITSEEIFEKYIPFIKSDEYLKSIPYKLRCILIDFNNTSGYYDIFLPSLKELSPSYSKYCKQLKILNDKLVEKYPDIERLNF